ncbi:MAG: hypothetical protein JXR46_09405 [Calditrichaceae bacterium]|nr:hypothetical protein [Calditrichaceae bacterium]MBN2709248.1 hypothetical protein [Calditrichaceae bacterium]RQV96201.1 MAG: hypothetical protein EH224_05715 [Calditrichota bacterium]
MNLKNFFLAIFSMIFLNLGFLQAGNNPDSLETKNKSVCSDIFKTNAMQFQVMDIFSLSDFQGTLISYKYHLSNKSAVRIGLGFNMDNIDDTEKQINDSDPVSIYLNGNESYYNISFRAQYVYYFNPQNEIKFYSGAGPYVAYILSTNESTEEGFYSPNSEIQSRVRTYEQEIITYNLGLSGIYGLEWFFKENMSLTAEYGFLFYYSYEDMKMTNEIITEYSYYSNSHESNNTQNETSKGLSFRSEGVLFGLSVYF